MKLLSKTRVDWVTRRYRVPEFAKKELKSSIKAWVRQRGFSIISQPKIDLYKLYWYTGYNIAPSKISLLKKFVIDMVVPYQDPLLYVFYTQYFPAELHDIFEEVFADYASRHGGEWIAETPVAFTTSYIATSILHHFESLQVDYALDVEFRPELERVEAAVEEIHVPPGVMVTVKRSRTIKRTVEVVLQQVEGHKVDAGLSFGQLDILRATIHNELRRQTGQSLEEAETIEYEVTLDGNKSTTYSLVWADLVRHGSIAIRQEGQERRLPFHARERTELHVVAA